MQNYPELVQAMRAALAWSGTLRISEEGPAGQVRLRTSDGREYAFDAPLAGILEGISANDPEIMAHPDDEIALSGQLRLFAIHVQEAIDTSGGGERLLQFTEYGVEAR